MKFKIVFLVANVFLLSCATTKAPTGNTVRVTPKFDFSPPTRASVGATNLTIALIHPIYVKDNAEFFVSPFPEMSSAMSNDFEEILTAKGFRIRSGFKSRDELVYSDKMNSDFALDIQIDLQPNYDNRKYKYTSGVGVFVPASYRMSGDITLTGNLIIVASSAKSGEKLWKKNIALDRQSFSYVGSIKWESLPSMADELKGDTELYNLLARQLEVFYNKSLALAWQQIDPAEMKAVAEQAKKSDSK